MTKLCFGWRKSRKHEKETQTPSGSCASPVQQPKIEAKNAASAPSFPDGVEVWYDCPDAALDIYFVHGLTGDRNHTWTADGERVPWPKTFLPPRLAETRILTYGYDAYVVKKTTASVNRLLDHANNLLQDFSTDRAICGVGKRPVVFVAHSLGGLVCKKAILQSAESPQPRLRALFESTKGIIFLGTPHDGSSMAAWAKIPASALSLVKSTNLSLLGVLGSDNELLESIQVSFRNLVRTSKANGKPIEVTCFFEQLPILGVGVVVPKRSAAIAGEEEPMSINADHRGMTKFTSVEDNGFKRLFGELIRWKSEIDADNLLPTDSRPDPDMLAACLDILLFPQMHSRSHGIERPVEGTCEWLLEHTTLREWAERQRGMLWIKGKPGSGKSTLLKYAFEKRQRIISTGEDSLVLSFFFHGRGNHLQKSPVGFLRSLAYQIIRQVPETLTGSGDSFQQRCREVHRQGDKGEWHPRELQDFVEQSLSKILASRGAWLFVDALDECGKASAVEMFKWFTHLMKKLSVSGFGLHLCVSCRHYPILSQACEFEICPEHQNREDMSAYVQSRFQDSVSLQKSKIPDLITYRASGVFMWARIVIDEAIDLDNEGASLASIESRVTSIPKELDELYSELIGHMNDKPNSIRLIQWICFARQPLTLSELRWAMVIDPDSSNRLYEYYSQHHDYIRDKDQLKRRIQALSCGLAEILPTEEGHVQLVHQSAKDFLVERGLAMLDYKASSPHGTVVGKAHFCLAKSCLRYLALDIMPDFDSMKRKIEHRIRLTAPLLEYAVSSWTEHAMRSDEEGVPQDDILEIVAWPSNDLVELWMSYAFILGRLSPQLDKGSNLVHLSALYGIPGLLAAVYRKTGHDHPYCRHDRGHTPLNIASVRGRRKIAKMLIDPDYAMRVAAATGIESASVKPTTDATDLGRGGSDPRPKSVVKIGPLPLNKDVEINSQGFEGRTPLLGAVCGGHVDIVKLLLETGKADINAKDLWGGTALTWAAIDCSSEIVGLLLATGELQLDPVDYAGRTPLSLAAAERGSLRTLQLLLDTGKVDVNTRCPGGRTPLSYAAGQGCIDNVGALLKEEKIDINSRDFTGRTALTWALRGLENLETMTPRMDLASMQELRWAYEKTVELLRSVGAVTEETQQ